MSDDSEKRSKPIVVGVRGAVDAERARRLAELRTAGETREIVFRHKADDVLRGPQPAARNPGRRGVYRERSNALDKMKSVRRSGRSREWLKMKSPACAAVKREEEED
jgi:hypothetical protein